MLTFSRCKCDVDNIVIRVPLNTPNRGIIIGKFSLKQQHYGIPSCCCLVSSDFYGFSTPVGVTLCARHIVSTGVTLCARHVLFVFRFSARFSCRCDMVSTVRATAEIQATQLRVTLYNNNFIAQLRLMGLKIQLCHNRLCTLFNPLHACYDYYCF